MKKRLISLCVILILIVATIPAVLAGAGVELTESRADSGNGWTWNPSTRTLTLNGANDNSDFFLKAEGGSTIILTDRTENALGSITFLGQLTLRGNGTLKSSTLSGLGDLTIESGNIYIAGNSPKMFACDNLTLTGGKLTVESSGSNTIECQTKLLMTGGELNATAKARDVGASHFSGDGISMRTWISADQIEITGGTVSLTAADGYGGQLVGTDGTSGQRLVLRNCTLTWTDSGYGELANFANVTIERAKLQWLQRESNDSDNGYIMSSSAPTISGVKKGSYSVEGPVRFDFEDRDRYYINIAKGGLLPDGASVPQEKPVTPVTPSVTAAPTNDALTSDGAAQSPTVYKIGGSNYFKIRDLAAILNGTSKQFSVGYDSALKSVTATTGEGYTKLDTDLTGAPAGGSKAAQTSNDAIYINGEKIDAEVYKIDGNNYFKLRDLGKALDFYVGWSKEQGVFIETDKPYSE